MTTTLTMPTQDELVTTALELVTTALDRVYYAKKGLAKPLTIAQLHAIGQHLTVLEGNLDTIQRLLTLLTPPLRPEQMEVS